jgi:hypothetical protein
MRLGQKIWLIMSGLACSLGISAAKAAANNYDQVELHSGSSSGPVWSGQGVSNGIGSFIFSASILQITCNVSSGQGTINSAGVGSVQSTIVQFNSQRGCPGSGGTTWTATPMLPWSVHGLYDQTTNNFVTITGNVNYLMTDGVACRYRGANESFSDIGIADAVVGSGTNPVGGNPGKVTGIAQLVRTSGNGLVCPATASATGTLTSQGLRSGTLFNVWGRNQGARVQ